MKRGVTSMAALLLGLGALVALGQKEPHLGYLYPAGGQRGTTIHAVAGGQYLEGVSALRVLDGGIQCEIGRRLKILTPQQLNGYRNNIERLQELETIAKTNAAQKLPAEKLRTQLVAQLREIGIEEVSLKAVAAYSKKVSDPKRQLNPALSETVDLVLTIPADAPLGDREVRLQTPNGLSNPMIFRVGSLPEAVEREPNNRKPDTAVTASIPFVVNGQILPGDVDRFRFAGHKGDRIVAAASARELIPYLADAVPGWFQATLALYDDKGRELEYQDDFRFNPDPVLFRELPADGDYTIEIKDSIFRGREDFVYRIAVGVLPFAAGIFPMGGTAGEDHDVDVVGWNLPARRVKLATASQPPGVHDVDIGAGGQVWNRLPFALDSVAATSEVEPNDDAKKAQSIVTPALLDGRIDRPGDQDVFVFQGRAGEEIVAETVARRLGSPMDSVLALEDATGKQLAMNDDCDDKGAGLTTHQADARLSTRLPVDGLYRLRVADSQHAGGEAFRYRLRLGPLASDFALRVTPTCLNLRPGETLAFTVFALRHDGFDGDIELALKDAPPGFHLAGGWIPAGQNKSRVTLTAPVEAAGRITALQLLGKARVADRDVVRMATPAEDLMQAFFYRHLVPSRDAWTAFVSEKNKNRSTATLTSASPVRIAPGASTHVRFAVKPFLPAKDLTFTLNDPPEGISIEKSTAADQGIDLYLRADPEKAKRGLKGTLIVDVFTERIPQAMEGKPKPEKQRVSLGCLPAIPFAVSEAAAAAPPRAP